MNGSFLSASSLQNKRTENIFHIFLHISELQRFHSWKRKTPTTWELGGWHYLPGTHEMDFSLNEPVVSVVPPVNWAGHISFRVPVWKITDGFHISRLLICIMRSVNTLVTLWYLESSCIWFAFWSCSIGRCALHLSRESHSARLALLLIALPRWWGKFGLGSPVNSCCCCLCSCHIFHFAFAVSLLTAALWESFLAGIKDDCGSTCWTPEPVNQTRLCQHLKKQNT